MINFIVLLILVLIAVHARWLFRRTGHVDGALVLRDVGVGAAILYLLINGAEFLLDVQWWKELGQLPTYWQFLRIRWLPQTAAALAGMLLLYFVFRAACRHVSTNLTRTRLFTVAGALVSILVGLIVSYSAIDPWTIALFIGAREPGAYRDPLFGRSLTFYLFRLPFYEMIFGWVAALAVATLVIFSVTVALGSSGQHLQAWRDRMAAQMGGQFGPIRVNPLPRLSVAPYVRAGAALLLVLYAVGQFFGRYDLLYSRHRFLYGADYVDARIGLPLLWVQIVGALLLAAVVLFARSGRRIRTGGWLDDLPVWLVPVTVGSFVVLFIAPALIQGAVRGIYVSPNELTLERPFIRDHIQATLSAFNLETRAKESTYVPRVTDTLNLNQYPDTTNNIRLWDWKPFQDNITQLQALRPYYSFPDVDVDRYQTNGQVRQILLAVRSLDTTLLPPSAQTWVNLHLQYTHGYGAVAALVNSATPEGQPELVLQDAPAITTVPRFHLSQPGVYFGENTTQPVYVDTNQPEFDYPRGDDNAYTTYAGRAGIPMGNAAMRLAAAIDQNDTNVLVSSYFTHNTRLLLHRQIIDRVQRMVPFLTLDPDPYLVIGDHGHLFWMLDAYTMSDRHPYAEPVTMGDQEFNYIRNSVKITIDAYNGTVNFYVFDEQDPILAAYRRVFPHLFLPRSQMPAGLQRHIRYPEMIFQAQAETYRLYHMQDPQVFYNKEDQWDIARQVVSQEETSATRPYYVMLQLPGQNQAEFVLMLPFTSHNRDNLISWMAARCDPGHYGQVIFYRLPKEQLIYGPLQIEGRVDQDRNISKDLSLWNQQGSRVIRGTTMVLPVDGTFLYVEPIYIQATQAKLPELKKVVLAVGNRLVYSDDLPGAIAALAQAPAGEAAAAASTTAAALTPSRAMAGSTAGAVTLSPQAVGELQQHLERYRQLTAQGKFADAGRELEAVEDVLRRAARVPPAKH